MLMALGCAFIFLVFVVTWRKRMRKKRAQATAMFASAKRLDQPMSWRMRLVRFGERLFGHSPNQRWVVPKETEAMKLEKLRDAEEARHDRAMEKLSGYDPRAESHRQPSPLPSLRNYDDHYEARRQPDKRVSTASLSTDSLYTQVTGMPRRTPEPRQPVKKNPRELLPSRFSDSTRGSQDLLEPFRAPTPAQEYARSVTQGQDPSRGSYWLKPSHTGASSNPFRR